MAQKAYNSYYLALHRKSGLFPLPLLHPSIAGPRLLREKKSFFYEDDDETNVLRYLTHTQHIPYNNGYQC